MLEGYGGERTQEELKRDVYVLMHPLRHSIVDLLDGSREGMHINKLAEELQENRQLVSFHLLTLSENEFVEGDYFISEKPHSKGKAVKVYKLTNKTREILKRLKDSL